MKTLFLVASLFLTAQSAHAMHAYATDECVGLTILNREVSFGLANDVPTAFHRLHVTDADGNSPQIEVSVGSEGDEKNSPLQLRKLSENKTGTIDVGDECFVGKGYSSVRKYRVEAANKLVNDKTGLKKGDVVYFTCYSDQQEPSGSGCEK